MKILINLSKTLNIIALSFLIFGAYGLPVTGFLQVVAALLHFIAFPKNKLIYIYFSLVILFFIFWNGGFNWFFIIPAFLLFFLSYIIHFQKDINSFLTAKWKNLALINYEIDKSILEKYVPMGTEIDLYNGKCYISLVGFLFQDTKVVGLKIPFHMNFEEVNLRFYVKRFENGEWKRGVVFIKEIVPKSAITFIANSLYKEHYQTLPMKHAIVESKNTTDFTYQWKTKNKWNTILIETEGENLDIEIGTAFEFITEHYFGYTKYNENKTFEYEVKHPKWKQQKVLQTIIDADFKATYGNEFEFLNNQEPEFTIFALGSEISVESKKTINHENINSKLAHHS